METINIKAELLLTLDNKQDWIRKCPGHLPDKKYSGERFLFVDKNGFYLAMSEDFAAADKLDTYPVKVYRLIRTSVLIEK